MLHNVSIEWVWVPLAYTVSLPCVYSTDVVEREVPANMQEEVEEKRNELIGGYNQAFFLSICVEFAPYCFMNRLVSYSSPKLG